MRMHFKSNYMIAWSLFLQRLFILVQRMVRGNEAIEMAD
ncbi:hypothetical protein [Paenibacillus phage Pd_22F]|nr:hypothetical protein [Paenibacillus phage Pd_22F]